MENNLPKKKKILVSPSIISCDFSCLKKEIKIIEDSSADSIHADIMDGHFVPNITIGHDIIQSIQRLTSLPIISHLMIQKPERYIERFIKAGSNSIIFHIESTNKSKEIISKIKSFGVQAGISIKPKTSIIEIEPFLDIIDSILVMTVEPGFSGQKFLIDQIPKINRLREIYKGQIAVDGGIDFQTAELVKKANVDLLVVGSFFFDYLKSHDGDIKKGVEILKKIN